MSDESKYYFTFDRTCINPRTKVKMQQYWVEVIGADTRAEARDTMCKLYGCGFTQFDPKNFSKDLFTSGCYERIYLPLPDEISVDDQDPFFGPRKKVKKKSSGEKRRMAAHSHFNNGGSINGNYSISKPIGKLDVLVKLIADDNIKLTDIHRATQIPYETLIDLRSGGFLKFPDQAINDICFYLGVDINPHDVYMRIHESRM